MVPAYEEDEEVDLEEPMQPENIMETSWQDDNSTEPLLHPEDLFTGNIDLPPEYTDDDFVPFEEEEIFMNSEMGEPKTLYTERPQTVLEEMEPEEVELEEGLQDDFSEEADGLNYDEFFIPEEPKRVETATGKIIETDTEMLRKKLEAKRAEAVKEGVPAAVAAAEQEKPKKESSSRL